MKKNNFVVLTTFFVKNTSLKYYLKAHELKNKKYSSVLLNNFIKYQDLNDQLLACKIHITNKYKQNQIKKIMVELNDIDKLNELNEDDLIKKFDEYSTFIYRISH